MADSDSGPKLSACANYSAPIPLVKDRRDNGQVSHLRPSNMKEKAS